jgi:hypothetical protein
LWEVLTNPVVVMTFAGLAVSLLRSGPLPPFVDLMLKSFGVRGEGLATLLWR